ncbi:MAG: hypothetical protein A3J29_21040 [Acidobacteria bacterium RIFCSPLOWO2_12_FULL_67_14b]|nr:MAG: hypothetical protein A3J29_21040 [Acidobacteria bacterium RIFCSPLOWO2_12_FULL_67_14b]
MSQESETVLQKSLDAVDHLRRRFLWAIAAVIVLAVVGALELFTVSRFGDDVEEHIRSWTVLLFFYIAGWALAVCLHVTRMTKKILLGIELLSKG